MTLSRERLEAAVLELLEAHTVLTLCTVGGDRVPHAVSLMYAHDGWSLYWLSDPATRHSRHLEAAGACAATIAGQGSDFRSIRGLQIRGEGEVLAEGEPRVRAERVLGARFPFLAEFAGGELGRRRAVALAYRLRCREITLIDNRRGFGFKQVLALDG